MAELWKHYQVEIFCIWRGNNSTFVRQTKIEPLCGYLRTSISLRFFFFHEIFDFSTKSSLVYEKWLCLVALLVFERYFHFGSGISDYITMLKLVLDGNKHSIFTEQNVDVKLRFLQNLLGLIVPLISKIVASSIAIVAGRRFCRKYPYRGSKSPNDNDR